MKKRTTPENNMSKSPSAKDESIEHYNAILLEKLDSNMQLVIETVETTRDDIYLKMSDQKKQINDRFDIIESVLKDHSKAINGLKTDVGGLKADVSELKTEMRNMETRLSEKIDGNTSMLENHEIRITALEETR